MSLRRVQHQCPLVTLHTSPRPCELLLCVYNLHSFSACVFGLSAHMGNCLILMSFEPSLTSPAFPSPPCLASLTMKLFSAAADGSPDDSMPKRPKLAPFVPILPYATPSNLSDLYLLGPELGRGQFGIIHSCKHHSSGTLFACKSIPKVHLHSITHIKDVVCEVSIMKHLSNHTPPHGCPPGSIVQLHEVLEDSCSVHLIMELCNGGELFDRIVKKARYPEAQAAVVMKSLLETLQFCHSMGIMHRDLKPENILLVDDSDTSDIKLADFGLALQFSPGQKFSGMAGSAYYVAPEVLRGKYSQEIDMWSAGVIMYVLLSGVPPFWGLTEQGIFEAIQEGQLDFKSDPWHTISSPAKDLITHLLCVDANLRWTPEQALKHPWIVNHTTARQISEASVTSSNVHLKPKISVSLATSQHDEAVKEQQSSPITPTIVIDLTEPSMIELTRKGKPELHMLLADLVANLDKNNVSLSESLQMTELPRGWTCTFLTVSTTEETLFVDMGKDKYLIVHDKQKKRVGWKALRQRRLRRTDNDILSPRKLQALQLVF